MPRMFTYTPNETIGGVDFGYIPSNRRDTPLFADMSVRAAFARPFAVVEDSASIYAGSQKNIGPSRVVW